MHESLVTLQLLLNLTTADILVLNAKTHGGYDDGMSRGGQCTFIQPPIVSPALVEYLESDEWMQDKRGSNLLYATVNRSLDLTIASLDPTQFQQQLRRYKWALEQVEARCRNKVRFPCSAEGVKQERHDCLLWDSGCGNDCLDEVSQELGL
ncbi:sulfotransferase family [Fragilaria crotonensis]|nr:sulfotransferase family [Fragilaria crotonensis]